MDHLYCPNSVHASIGDNIYSFSQSVYQVKDVHARVGLNYSSFVSSFDGTMDNERYLRTILFLEGLLQHYSLHSVLPKVLVYDLATGCFYPGLKQHYWVIHLRQAQAAFPRTSNQMIQAIPALSYFDTTDDQLCLVTCTIQQLLVEHALYLHRPMTMAHIQQVAVGLRFLPPPSNTYMHLDDFVGFNVRQLHSNLLKFHYHQNGGILYAAHGFATYSMAFLIESACSPLLPSHILPWMRWSRQVLGNVVSIIGLYCGRHLINYLIEDKNRVSFLAFEFILRHLDALTLPVVENWDKTLLLELRLIFNIYHTNISYETGIKTLFLSDQQLSSASFAFDRPPDSSQSSNKDSHKAAPTSS